jgi:uncharacterized protein (TIGR02246 family)
VILLGAPNAVEVFADLSQKLDEAYNKNDAVAVAALFTEDAVLVAPDGRFSGRQDIEKRYADTFQRSPISDFKSRRERRHLNAIDNAVWSVGQWASTLQKVSVYRFITAFSIDDCASIMLGIYAMVEGWTALFTPENSTSGRGQSARRTILAPG